MKSNDKIKIMLVGDYLIFRNSLKLLIESQSNFKVINEVSDFSEVEVLINNNKPDILLIDSKELAHEDFVKFTEKQGENIPILVLTNSTNAKTHQKYLLAGASGVVTKKQKSTVLFKALEKVNSDDLWFKREVMKKTIEKLMKEKSLTPEKIHSTKYNILTQREREVLKLICKGMKNKEIATSLFITETTVRHHLTSIFEKFNVKSRLELAILSFNEGLAEVPQKKEKL
jgi:DNA-binding NarL/FixJ family response regulator